jgi:mono/diheme cytochrome c family protein
MMALVLVCFPWGSPDDPPDFERDIRPIFERHCISCHGPDKQKSSYRLDRKSAALGRAEIGRPIVPGRPSESPLLRYVSGVDPDLVMPPKGPRLSPEEIARVRAWIDAGAPWPEDRTPGEVHWAFKPLQSLPSTDIDTLVRARLKAAGLSAAPQADRRTLYRRLSFDLLGLPPAPEDIDAFEQDPDSGAYDKLVEKFLASPRYGERWARHWLDVVRFAESHGFEMNQPRPNAWPYRDWVIRSFNEDLPYDRFVLAQLAGDQLGADEATGFLVAGPWDQVKSPDPVLTAQQRADEMNDMVATTGTAFLGLTFGCARCHNHKFDPIAQADYTALVACLAGVEHGERAIPPADAIERNRQADVLRVRLRPIETEIDRCEPIASLKKTIWVDPQSIGPPATSKPYALAALGKGYCAWTNCAGKDVSTWKPGAEGRYRIWLSWGAGGGSNASDSRYYLETDGERREIARPDQRKLADGREIGTQKPVWSGFFDAGVHELKTGSTVLLQGGRDGDVTSDVMLLQEDTAGPAPRLRSAVRQGRNVERFEPVESKFVRFTISATNQMEPCIDELEVFSAEPEPRNVARSAVPSASGTYPGNPFHRLEHINDGLYGNSRSWISNERGKGWVQLEFQRPERIDRVVWSRDRDEEPRYDDRIATEYRVDVSSDGRSWQPVASSEDRLPRSRFGGREMPPEVPATVLREREEILRRIKDLVTFPTVYAGKFVKPPAVRRLHRGDVTQPKEEIGPGVLAGVGGTVSIPPGASDPERRLALARWIADPGNPLTARVMVNRLWHYHFGTGLVDTPSDFGKNGGRPSHPELLDFLACELIRQHWSLKSIHRMIVTSATYRQSSGMRAEASREDAGARLLWRYPPQRLEAEALRDSILAVSGALNLQMGGPGFDLFESNANYVKVYTPRSTFGPSEFRRMVYQSKPRMELDSVFGVFDCPDGGQIAPRRTVSTTPLQALNLQNSAFILQQSAFFAARLEREGGPAVERAFLLAFGRRPEPEEARAAEQLVKDYGLRALCRALFNANEFITVR